MGFPTPVGGGRLFADDALPVRFEGLDTIEPEAAEAAIRADIEGWISSGYRASFLEDAVYDLRRVHRDAGFHFVSVTYRVESSAGKPAVVFTVREGPLVTLENIRVRGVEGFLPEELEDLTGDVVPSLVGKTFVERFLQEDLDNILEFYDRHGFVDAQVAGRTLEFGAERTGVEVLVTIDVGPRYTTASSEYPGLTAMGRERLERYLANKPRAPFIRRELARDAARIERALGDRGYAWAKATPEEALTPATGRADLTFHVEQGPLTRIGEIAVFGNEDTRSSFIRRLVIFEPGDLYDRGDFVDAQRRLMETQLFRSVVITFDKMDEAGERIRVTVRVEEARPGEIRVRAGLGAYEGPRFGVQGAYRNFFGIGHELSIEGKISLVGERGEIAYENPWLWGSFVSQRVAVSVEEREEPGYSFETVAGKYGLSYDIRRYWKAGVGYTWERTEIFDVDDDLPQIEEDLFRIRSVYGQLTRDTTDDPADPHRGWRASTGYEYGGGFLRGDVDFYRVTASSSLYFHLGGDLVLALGLRWGTVRPRGDTESIPLTKRLFAGGESTIRGFGQNLVGPLADEETPLGGEVSAISNVELRFPIWAGLHGVAFGDGGNVWEEARDVDFGRNRTGAGVGVRYLTPIGPIRLEYAWNLHPLDDEDDAVLYFSVGYPF